MLTEGIPILTVDKAKLQIKNINNHILTLNDENRLLLQNLNTLDNQDFAGHGELFDKKNIYNEIFIKNIILILIILGSSIMGIYNYKQINK